MTTNFDPWRNTSLWWKQVKIHTWCRWWTLSNEQTVHGARAVSGNDWPGSIGGSTLAYQCFHKQEIALHTDGGKAAWMLDNFSLQNTPTIVMEGREYFFPYTLCNGCYEREKIRGGEPEQRALARLLTMIRRNGT